MEEVWEEIRRSDPPVYYLVGAPKGRLEVSYGDGPLKFFLRKDLAYALHLNSQWRLCNYHATVRLYR